MSTLEKDKKIEILKAVDYLLYLCPEKGEFFISDNFYKKINKMLSTNYIFNERIMKVI